MERLREPNEKEIKIMEKCSFLNPNNYLVIEGDTDKTQLVLISRRGRRRTIKLDKGKIVK